MTPARTALAAADDHAPAPRPPDMGTPVRILSAVIRSSRQNGRGKNGKSFLAPEDQRKLIERWCAANNAMVPEDRWHYETEGRNSGGAKNWEKREGLHAALAEVLGGVTDGLIVANVKRFARTWLDGVMAIHELHTNGRLFIAVDEGIDGRDPKNLGAKIMLDIYLRIAEAQLEEMTETWARVVEMQIMSGIANYCPWGYLRCGMNGTEHAPDCEGPAHPLHRHLVPDPERAPWVVRLFERRAEGASWSGLADWLNAKGVVPARGGAWSFESVRNIVSGPPSRTYLGELRSGDIVNPAAHEPIVTRDLFERANVRQATPRARSAAAAYMLHGLVRCASCGSRLRGNTQAGGRVYRCKGRHSWGVCPRPARISADDLEALVNEQFERDYVSHARWTAVESTDDLKAAEARLRDAIAECDAWQHDPTTLRMRQVMGEASYQAAMSARLDDIEAAQEDVRAAEGALLPKRLPASLAELWPTMDDDDRRALLALIYPVIAVRPARTRGSRWDDEPVADRVRVFEANEVDALGPLPGRGAGAELRPIPVAA
jgi:hypothetical protein